MNCIIDNDKPLTTQQQIDDLEAVINQLTEEQEQQPHLWLSLQMSIAECKQLQRELVEQDDVWLEHLTAPHNGEDYQEWMQWQQDQEQQ